MVYSTLLEDKSPSKALASCLAINNQARALLDCIPIANIPESLQPRSPLHISQCIAGRM
jgi:hypothetical protein